MNETRHTPEPWRWIPADDDEPRQAMALVGADWEPGEDEILYHGSNWAIRPEDAARIVACVNALAGMNPEAVAELREAAVSEQLAALRARRDAIAGRREPTRRRIAEGEAKALGNLGEIDLAIRRLEDAAPAWTSADSQHYIDTGQTPSDGGGDAHEALRTVADDAAAWLRDLSDDLRASGWGETSEEATTIAARLELAE